MALVDLNALKDDNWDITAARVAEYIDGVNHVARIAELADADPALTRETLRHMLYVVSPRARANGQVLPSHHDDRHIPVRQHVHPEAQHHPLGSGRIHNQRMWNLYYPVRIDPTQLANTLTLVLETPPRDNSPSMDRSQRRPKSGD